MKEIDNTNQAKDDSKNQIDIIEEANKEIELMIANLKQSLQQLQSELNKVEQKMIIHLKAIAEIKEILELLEKKKYQKFYIRFPNLYLKIKLMKSD